MAKEERYLNRELDDKFADIHEKLDNILTQVTYTNGKVKRITLALVAVGCLSLGLGISNVEQISSIILTLL